MPVGRPTELSDDLIDDIVTHILAGNFRVVAAGACGVPQRTFRRWCQRGKTERSSVYGRLWHAIVKAERTAEIAAVAAAKSGDAKNAQWWLTHKFPERWGSAAYLQSLLRRMLTELEKERKRGTGEPPAAA